MNAIVIDHHAVVAIELRSIIGNQAKAVWTWFLDPKPAGIIYGKPLGTFGNPREALSETARRDVQKIDIDAAARFQSVESWKPGRMRGNVIHLAVQARWSDHSGSK